jgi:hypothetical protein
MAFSMTGTTGQVRHRIHPRKVRGPSGYKGERTFTPTEVKRTHTKLYEEPKKGFLSKVAAKAKNLFRRGAK